MTLDMLYLILKIMETRKLQKACEFLLFANKNFKSKNATITKKPIHFACSHQLRADIAEAHSVLRQNTNVESFVTIVNNFFPSSPS